MRKRIAPSVVPEAPPPPPPVEEGKTVLFVRANYNRNCVLVFNRGPKITYYLGVENGPWLHTQQMENELFEKEYYHTPQKADYSTYSPMDFALVYMRDRIAQAMVPISPSAIRVLRAIIAGQPTDGIAESTLNSLLENSMAAAKEETGFRKPDGPVAMVHKYLDSRLEGIKAGTVSRKECIDKLTEKGYANGTIVTQCGVWARTNGVSFARPAAAAETKKAVVAKKKAKAKKAVAAA